MFDYWKGWWDGCWPGRTASLGGWVRSASSTFPWTRRTGPRRKLAVHSIAAILSQTTVLRDKYSKHWLSASFRRICTDSLRQSQERTLRKKGLYCTKTRVSVQSYELGPPSPPPPASECIPLWVLRGVGGNTLVCGGRKLAAHSSRHFVSNNCSPSSETNTVNIDCERATGVFVQKAWDSHKSGLYLKGLCNTEYQSFCLVVLNWVPPPPSPASECVAPHHWGRLGGGGGRHTHLRWRGWVGPIPTKGQTIKTINDSDERHSSFNM